jgi:hypothetical protein
MQPSQAAKFRADLRLVQEKNKAGVTDQRSRAQDKHWERWDAFCSENNIDPFIRTWNYPIPVLQVFGQRYRDGCIAPSRKCVRSQTVEDALRAFGQTFARLGASDVRKDFSVEIDFRIRRQLRAYKKEDSPPSRVKPISIIIIGYILDLAYGAERKDDEQAIADMIAIAFFFLLRPGEYTGTTTDDAYFCMQDVSLYIHQRRLDTMLVTYTELDSATSVAYTFTTQKNGTRGEKMIHSRSGNALCCPVWASIRSIKHLRMHIAKSTAPIASYYKGVRRVAIKARDVTDTLRSAMKANVHRTGVHAHEISARSIRAGGAMALLCGNVDFDLIQILGRWHSDAMIRYFHMQAQPVMQNFASTMFNNGTYDFLPGELVPINDADHEE